MNDIPSHFLVETLRVVFFLVATIILWRKHKSKGIGLWVMVIALVWELLTAPLMWVFGERINQNFVVAFVQVSWAATTLGFALGLFLFAFRSARPS